MKPKHLRWLAVPLAASVGLAAQGAGAAVITGWNLNNVVPGPSGVSGASVVYDRDVTGGVGSAVTNSRIAYDFPEADSPGLTVQQGPFTFGGQTTAGCILATSGTTCDGPRQSGKRFKHQLTGFGPTDLVFDVDPNAPSPEGSENGWQVFQAIINETGSRIAGVKFELGFGVGDQFQGSAPNDGLNFSESFAFGPEDQNAFTIFPFGLFGDADQNPNQTLSGFFDPTGRSGFNLPFGEDLLATDGYYGSYPSLFGQFQSVSEVPTGAFWDNDGDPDTDAILMAWLNEDGLWEVRRKIENGEPVTIDETDPNETATIETFATLEEAEAFLEAQLGTDLALETNIIEDLAKFNVNYAIQLGEDISFTDFTLRITAHAVPLPGGLPLLLGALALTGLAARRRAA